MAPLRTPERLSAARGARTSVATRSGEQLDESILERIWAVGAIVGGSCSGSGSSQPGRRPTTGRQNQTASLVALDGPPTTVAVALDDRI